MPGPHAECGDLTALRWSPGLFWKWRSTEATSQKRGPGMGEGRSSCGRTYLPLTSDMALKKGLFEIRPPSCAQSWGLLYLRPPVPSVLVPEVKPGSTPTLGLQNKHHRRSLSEKSTLILQLQLS